MGAAYGRVPSESDESLSAGMPANSGRPAMARGCTVTCVSSRCFTVAIEGLAARARGGLAIRRVVCMLAW